MRVIVQRCGHHLHYCVNGALALEGFLSRKGIAAQYWVEWAGVAGIGAGQVKRRHKIRLGNLINSVLIYKDFSRKALTKVKKI